MVQVKSMKDGIKINFTEEEMNILDNLAEIDDISIEELLEKIYTTSCIQTNICWNKAIDTIEQNLKEYQRNAT